MSLIWVAIFATLAVACNGGMLDYKIETTWNGSAIDHPPVQMRVESEEGSTTDVRLTITTAPFFNNEPPPAKPGEPLWELWNYEVVEAFFLNDKEQYLEIELAPGGQHIDLLLFHPRNIIRHSLPMKTSTYITGDTWSGHCTIPGEYFPFNVTLFNAYAVHNGPDGERHFESLYPADPSETEVEFHNLKYFKPIDMGQVLDTYPTAGQSQFWLDALDGIFRYDITTEWNGVPINHPDAVEVSIQSATDGVTMKVRAPFFNDPAPPDPAGSLMGLWNYEVAEMFFLNDNDEYVEVEFGPHGHYIVLLLKGQSNSIKDSLPLTYTAEIGTDGFWTGEAVLPAGYFPPNVTKINVYGIHNGPEEGSRVYEALYPAPKDDPDYPAANFHRLDLFQKVDFEFQLKDNSEYSEIWLDAIGSSEPTVTPDKIPVTTDSTTTDGTERTGMNPTLLTYQITADWKGTPTAEEEQVELTLQADEDGGGVLLTVNAPYYNDTPHANYPNDTSYTLRDEEEVVEVYFLNKKEQYLQIKLTPTGEYEVSLFYGIKLQIRHSLPLVVDTEIMWDRWTSAVVIPNQYLPVGANKFNAYSKHGEGDGQKYSSLYPVVARDANTPEVHSVKNFNDINLNDVVPDFSDRPMSQLWQDSILGIFRYQILQDIAGSRVNHDPIEVTLQGFQGGLEINVTSPLFSNKSKEVISNTRWGCDQQKNREVAKFIFKNDEGESVNVEISPWGEFFMYFMNSNGQIVSGGNNLDYFVSVRHPRSADYPQGLWSGSVLLPFKYVPFNVSKFNIILSYGPANLRTFEALYWPSTTPNPDSTDIPFDFGSYTRGIDFRFLERKDRAESLYWKNILKRLPSILKLETDKTELCQRLSNEQSFKINKTWDGRIKTDTPVELKLQPHNGDVLLSVEAPLYSDSSPPGAPGKAFMGLWNYEVVEAFFLNVNGQYLEVEIAPEGQHLVLLLSRRRHPIRHSLPLAVITSVEDSHWEALAVIPSHYFPPQITKFNAYAINGEEPNRRYHSLYPADKDATIPDFHALKYFKSIDFSHILPTQNDDALSQLWEDSINGIFKYKLDKHIDGLPVTSNDEIINVLMKGFQAGVEINITAPYYGDSDLPAGSLHLDNKGNYEEIELFFMNSEKSYLSVRLGPQGHQLASFYHGANNAVKIGVPVDYFVVTLQEGSSNTPGKWKGSVLISPDYFPVNVTRFNMVARHGQGDDRKYTALYTNDKGQEYNPDKHDLEAFHPIDFEFLVENNKIMSQTWREVIALVQKNSRRRQGGVPSKRRRIPHQRARQNNNKFKQQSISSKTKLLKPLLPQPSRDITLRPTSNRNRRPSFEEDPGALNSIDRNSQQAFLSPQQTCIAPGLIKDRIRCQLFYECVVENGEWKVYKWRCSRGLIFDDEKVACVHGFC